MTLLNLPIPPEVKMIYLDNGATSFPKPQVCLLYTSPSPRD